MDNHQFSEREVSRICVLERLRRRDMTQLEAGLELGISERQIRRLYKAFKASGALSVKSSNRGGNRRHDDVLKAAVLARVKEVYEDFGPTFASEKLEELDNLRVNRETLRQWMMAAGLWQGRVRRSAKIHQSRPRRACVGELVQIDGSLHLWFEDRYQDPVCLIVFIDDATSRILYMRFEPRETTLGYMRGIQQYVDMYGRPHAFYSDRHAIFKTIRKEDKVFQSTQLERACQSLQIELICARSPQAKGRVERANGTLQNRLLREMRLRKISTIEEANAYLPQYIAWHNARYAVPPEKPHNAHRSLPHTPEMMHRILSKHYQRTLSKNLEFSFKNSIYQIQRIGSGYSLRGAQVIVQEHMDGTVEVWRKQERLQFKTHTPQRKSPKVVDRRYLDANYAQYLPESERPNYVFVNESRAFQTIKESKTLIA